MKNDIWLLAILPLELGTVAGLAVGGATAIVLRANGDPAALVNGTAAGLLSFGVAAAGAIAWVGQVWRDYLIPPPPPVMAENKVTVRMLQTDAGAPGYMQGEFFDLPADPDRLRALAADLVEDPDISMGRFAGKGKLFTRAEYETLRAALINRRLARWQNSRAHNTGAMLTGPGRAFFRALAGARGEDFPTSNDQPGF